MGIQEIENGEPERCGFLQSQIAKREILNLWKT
jgi:hypothetical protein